jgi:anti-sigma B factor antagonist
MNLKEITSDKAIIIEIEGRLDTTNFSQLENKIMGHVDAGKINILVDCSNMDYVSSSGLRIFLMSLKKITSLNGHFVLCGLQENIQEIFEISGFTSIFKIYDTQKIALDTF